MILNKITLIVRFIFVNLIEIFTDRSIIEKFNYFSTSTD